MRVLLVGSGGREHALAAALVASPLLDALFVAPGNPGTAAIGRNVPIAVDDVAGLVAFASANAVDLVLPGPEAPLAAGLADACAGANIACCGPTQAAAMLEASKAFAHEVAEAAGIPTARWERFETTEAALDFVRRRGVPIVVKADGLAAGKGVTVAMTLAEAEAAVLAHGLPLVIEECLDGDEVSLFALCDGADALLLGAAQDHKRLGEADTGPNTGGMGAVCPPAGFGAELQQACLAGIIKPALAEMVRRGTPFRGILFAGLMLTADGPKLIEFNVRFGDPECQALLLRLRSDLLPALVAACEGELAHVDLRWTDIASVAVVLAAPGYPGAPEAGSPIDGVARAEALPDVAVFHSGTALVEGRLVAAGGRVLTVCATGPDLGSARDAAYAGVTALGWAEAYYRRDIGLRSLART